MAKNPTLAGEHAHAIAAAISDYMSAQSVRYPDRAKACELAYHTLTARIEDALDYARIGEIGA